MAENKIILKTIRELLPNSFFIPSYQRGYRWTEQQVTDLLDDVWEFINKPNKKDDEWYCLQPVVVKKKIEKGEGDNSFLTRLQHVSSNSDEQNVLIQTKQLIEEFENHKNMEVVDGQQRLTTVFLILKYLEGVPFEIEYETRNTEHHNSKKFLQEIDLIQEDKEENKNIDFYHIYHAYQAIKIWFEDKLEKKKYFYDTLLEKVKVIWYETTDTDSINIFTRINSGKIPLTNAELIKALFLNSSNFENEDPEKLRLKQLEIASEWDRMEYALQDDSFWYFINKNENHLATRIEFIFDLMNEEKITDDYSTFIFFTKKFNAKQDDEIKENWKEIKKYYQTLEEWYNDRELYHKIGYLITIGISIKNVLRGKENRTKAEFKSWLDEQIVEYIASKKIIDDLEYGVDNNQLIKILLLHNIITTLNSEDTSLRFPFDKYKDKKNGGWSLEHIHAQNSDSISEIEDFENWLKAINREDLSSEIQEKIKTFEADRQKEKIPELVIEISNYFGPPELHSIENMALLSKNDNSKLNNGLFPVKRKRIIELENNGAFIPPATKKVFQKYYKGCTKQLSKWGKEDRDAYLLDIHEKLNIYLKKNDKK